MDILDRIKESQTLMMDAYKDFRDLCDELAMERSSGHEDFSSFDSIAPDADEPRLGPESYDEEAFVPRMSLEQVDMEDFGFEKSFRFEDINPEDPEYWGGKSLGIPYAVVVRQNDGMDKLLPIMNGKFEDYEL